MRSIYMINHSDVHLLLNNLLDFHIPFSIFSDYSKHEFYEIFFLSLPCLFQHQKSLAPVRSLKRYLFGEEGVPVVWNDQALSYFDILTASMLEKSLKDLANFEVIHKAKKKFKRKLKDL